MRYRNYHHIIAATVVSRVHDSFNFKILLFAGTLLQNSSALNTHVLFSAL